MNTWCVRARGNVMSMDEDMSSWLVDEKNGRMMVVMDDLRVLSLCGTTGGDVVIG